MSDRLLSENVYLATQIIYGYNRSNISLRTMLKIDLRKAFDSVRWDFLNSALRALRVPDRFIGWIQQCISIASFTLAVNGSSFGYFESTSGLRQGGPISPYILVLVMRVSLPYYHLSTRMVILGFILAPLNFKYLT